MNHDYRLGFPGLLALIEPEAKPAKPQVWPFPLKSSDPFETEDWTHVGCHLYGAAQAPQSESSRDKPAASSGSVETPAAPPSGQWVLTSERKPPVGDYLTCSGCEDDTWVRHWDGESWSYAWPANEPDARVNALNWRNDAFDFRWLDTSPATPKADADGWIAWHQQQDNMPEGAIEGKFRDGSTTNAYNVGTWGKFTNKSREIVAYRMGPQ